MKISGSAMVVLSVLLFWVWGNVCPISNPESKQGEVFSTSFPDKETATFNTSRPILPVAWTEQIKSQCNSETSKFSTLAFLTNYGIELIALTISPIKQAKTQLGYFHLNKQFCVLPNAP